MHVADICGDLRTVLLVIVLKLTSTGRRLSGDT